MMTPPRSDVPAMGDEIAIVHGCGQWYCGPGIVTAAEPGRIVLHVQTFSRMASPEHVPVMIESDHVLWGEWRWNRLADLREDEQAPMAAHNKRVAEYRAKHGAPAAGGLVSTRKTGGE